MASAKVENAAPMAPHFNRSEPGPVNIALAQFPNALKDEPKNLDEITENLVGNFNKSLEAHDAQGIVNLFLDDGYWRDHLALSWNYHTFHGQNAISGFLAAETQGLRKLTINRETSFRAPHYDALDGSGNLKGIEFFVDVETKDGVGTGLCRLVSLKPDDWKIFSLFTSLTDLKGHEEATGHKRPQGVEHGDQKDRQNWKERRKAESNFEDGQTPAVIIVGAGQAGLTVAARLKVLGVHSLIIDKEDRVGDNWRNRYKSLVLHDPVKYDNMPLLEFPDFWPTFTPKDKLAGWFEFYAEALELNIWTKSTVESSSWDEDNEEWTIKIFRTKDDGSKSTTTFHPRHVIQATGHSGKKNVPDIKGMDLFRGERICHSSEFPGAQPNANGKKAIVVGCCNSGHDISQAYYENGYDVTMVQRSSTCVVSSKAITNIALKGLYDDDGPATEDADIWLHGTPASVMKSIQVYITELQSEHDKEMTKGLELAGFKLNKGPQNSGLLQSYFQNGGGYYIDVGASQLIIDRKIKIKQGVEIEAVTEYGLRFADGTELEADEIIFATGYQNMRSEARTIFGDALADRVGDIWGFDKEGEMRNIWRPSGHPGFWFMGGNLALCRYYSRLLALQIKAREIGLVK